jgi:hypothetical protein
MIKIDWKAGESFIDVLLAKAKIEHAHIRISALRSLAVERRFPWGRSSQINEVREEVRESESKWEIEMQSGDTIIVRAESISLEEGSAPS